MGGIAVDWLDKVEGAGQEVVSERTRNWNLRACWNLQAGWTRGTNESHVENKIIRKIVPPAEFWGQTLGRTTRGERTISIQRYIL